MNGKTIDQVVSEAKEDAMINEPQVVFAPFRKYRRNKNTTKRKGRSFLKLYWITYLTVVAPLSIASIIVDMEPYSTILLSIQYIALFGNFIFLFLDIKTSSRRHKKWMSLMNQKIKIMREGTWSEEDRKKIEEINLQMEKYQ